MRNKVLYMSPKTEHKQKHIDDKSIWKLCKKIIEHYNIDSRP
jgi:hypothetical protein